MKVGFVFVLYKTPKSEKQRLEKEITRLGLRKSDVVFIDNSYNRNGYASGVNKGIKILMSKGYDLLVIGNPDISVEKLKIQDFIEAADVFDISSFAMLQNGSLHYCGRLDKKRLSSYLEKEHPKTKFVTCEYVTGSLMIIKNEVIKKIGLFDESYFMYYEDVEFCVRARRKGLKVGLVSTKKYEHFEISTNNPNKNKYLFTSWLKFFIKHSTTRLKIHELAVLPLTTFKNRNVILDIIIYKFKSLK